MHIIRLRGPWQCEAIERWEQTGGQWRPGGEVPPEQVQVQMPGDWSAPLGADFRGRARFVRHFGRPTNLGPGDSVRLAFTAACGHLQVALNGVPLGQGDTVSGPLTFDVAALLLPRNVLAVEVAHPSPRAINRGIATEDAGGLTGEVQLQIDSTR